MNADGSHKRVSTSKSSPRSSPYIWSRYVNPTGENFVTTKNPAFEQKPGFETG